MCGSFGCSSRHYNSSTRFTVRLLRAFQHETRAGYNAYARFETPPLFFKYGGVSTEVLYRQTEASCTEHDVHYRTIEGIRAIEGNRVTLCGPRERFLLMHGALD